MSHEQVAETLRRFERELAEAEATAKLALTREASLRQIVEGLQAYIRTETATPGSVPLFEIEPPSAPSKPSGVVEDAALPRGREAVRRLLIAHRGSMHVDRMAELARSYGWMGDVENLTRALNVSARRLVKDGEAEQTGPRTYRYRLDKLPPPPEEETETG